MIIFFVAVGFPTLLNTNVTFGYEGVEWTPITSAYAEYYQEQELMLTLATYNFNPIVTSAFLVIPTTIDNPPPDPDQYFALKYGQPISLESGFVETEKPEMISLKAVNLLHQVGSWVPIAWEEEVFEVEKSVYDKFNEENDFNLGFLGDIGFIQEAEATIIYVPMDKDILGALSGAGAECIADPYPDGGAISGAGGTLLANNQADITTTPCRVAIYNQSPLFPPELIDELTSILLRFKITSGASNHDCGVRRLDGIPSTQGGLMTAGDVWHNATGGAPLWTTNLNGGICRGQTLFTVPNDIGFTASGSALADFKNRVRTNLHPDGEKVSASDFSQPDGIVSTVVNWNGFPFRAGVNRFAVADGEYTRYTINIPVNNSQGFWQMKEHTQFPTGLMDDCKFQRLGDAFNINTATSDADQGQCMVFKTINKTAIEGKQFKTTISATKSGGTGSMRAFIDVIDGRMDMETIYAGGTGVLAITKTDHPENALRSDLGTGQNHRLGIMEVDLPFTGDIQVDPLYFASSESEITIYVGLKDNSTDGSISMNITSVQIDDNELYNFTQPVVWFYEHPINDGNPTPLKKIADYGFLSLNVTLPLGLGNSLNGVDNSTAPNTGSLGSSADAEYFEGGSLSTFVVNASGIINEAVIQNGTSSGDTQGEIHLGSDASLWDFLTIGNSGSNLTSINFWLNGDVVGATQYPLISSGSNTDANSFLLYTQSGDIRLLVKEAGTNIVNGGAFNGIIPADDGQWHMVTLLLNKTDTIGYARVCVDGSGNCDIEIGLALHTGTGSTPPDPLTIGDNTHNNVASLIIENTFNVDELTIWNGYSLTDTDIDNMYNSGAGASSDGIGASFQVLDMTFDLTQAIGSFPEITNPVPENAVLSGSVTLGKSLDIDWVHDGINTTGYRIYRTSTESGDEKILYSFETLITPQTQILSELPADYTAETSWGTTFVNEIVSRITMNHVFNSTGASGILRGAIFLDADQASSDGDFTIIKNSTTFRDPSVLAIPSDSPLTFNFYGTDLINLTSSVTTEGADNIGIGVSWDKTRVGDSGTTTFRSGDGIGGLTPRIVRADVSVPFWGTTNGQDLRAEFAVVNQTKLFSPEIPFVNDTGSLDTNFTDTTTIAKNTYFYRIVPLNGDIEGDTVVILNGTQGFNLNQTALDFVVAVDTVLAQLPVTSPPDQVVNLAISHDNINGELDLTWDVTPNADEYVVQRLSTERQQVEADGFGSESNFALSTSSTNDILGDDSGFDTFDIPTQSELRTGRFDFHDPTGGQVVYGYWLNVISGGVNQLEPDVQGEVNQTGFMMSHGTRLARDCSRMQTDYEQDGWTQRSTGKWFDGNCQVEQRYLGTQLKNLTVAETANAEIIGAFRKEFTSGEGFRVLRPFAGGGSGWRFQDSTFQWFTTSGLEIKSHVMNQTFINITTTTNNFFSDTTTNNYNSYFYRIIPKNILGENGTSSIVNGTLSLPPLRVPDLNATDNGATVDLVWAEAPIKKSRELSEDPIQGYIIQRATGGNETTIYDGLSHDVEEFFLDGTGLTTSNNPKDSSDRTHAGQQLNITQAVNITRIVVKLGCAGCGSFNVEPDISGSIHFANGTQITRSINPRIAMENDLGGALGDEGFVNWVFSPPIHLEPDEYIFGYQQAGAQTCNSGDCTTSVNRSFKVYFEETGVGGGSSGWAIGEDTISGIFTSNPINGTKDKDYAMAIYAETVWETIGTTTAGDLNFTDTSPPPTNTTKAYRVLAFNDAGVSHPPTLLHNPQNTTMVGMGVPQNDFFRENAQGTLTAGTLNYGEMVTFAVAPPIIAPDPINDLTVTPVSDSIFMNWTTPTGNVTGYRIERALSNETHYGETSEGNFFFPLHWENGAGFSLPAGTSFTIFTKEDPLHIVGQAFNATSDEKITSIVTTLYEQSALPCTIGQQTLMGSIFNNDTSAWIANSTNLVDACSVSTFSGFPPFRFTFDPPVEIASGSEYVIGITKNGTALDMEVRMLVGSRHNTAVDGFEVFSDTVPFVFNNTVTTNDAFMGVGFIDFDILVADTGSLITNFTDTTCPDGTTCHYNVRGLNGIVVADESNFAIGQEPIVEGTSDIANSTSSVWQYRELDTRRLVVPHMRIANDTDGLQFQSGQAGASLGDPRGCCVMFKSFNATLINGSDISTFYKHPPIGSTDLNIRVMEGFYQADDYFRLQNNDIGSDYPPAPSLPLSGSGDVIEQDITGDSVLASVNAPTSTVLTQFTLPAGSIDYADNESDWITVFFVFEDAQSNQHLYTIHNITISKIGTWNFTNSPVEQLVGSGGAGDPFGANTWNDNDLSSNDNLFNNQQDSGIITAGAGFSPPPPPDPVTDLTAVFNEETQSIELSWNASAGADSYRIFRTSTETADEVIEYQETAGGTPQNISMQGSSGDFDAILQRGDFFNGWIVDRWEGLVISRFEGGSGGNRCSENSAIGGFTTGSLFNDGMLTISSDNSTIANSTTIILPEDWGTNNALTWYYRGSDLLNITNGVNIDNARKLGIGISWWEGTSGTLNCDSRANVGEGGNSFWDFLTQIWTSNVANNDMLFTIAVINNTKLSADPEVDDTGSTATTFSDTNIDEASPVVGNTYFYRIVGLNALLEQGGFSNTVNATAVNATLTPPPTNVTAVQIGNDITINWTKEITADGYKILRKATNDTTSKVKGEDLPNDYLKLNDKPVGDVEIGGVRNQGTVTFNDFTCGGAQPCGRAQNFTMGNQDFTLDKIRLKIVGTSWSGGNSVLKVAVFNGSSASLNEILENSTDIFTSTIGSNPFPSGNFHDFEFDDFVLLANKTYMVGAYTNGSIVGTIQMYRDDTGFGFTSYATNFDNGELVTENGGDLTAWTRFNTLNLQIDLIGDQFEEIATLGDVDTFTDVLTSEDEGNLFFYKVQSLTGSTEGNVSSIVNQTAPLISGSDLFNSTSKIWQFREHDLEESILEGASGAGCLNNCGSGGKFPNANVSIDAQEGRTTADNGEPLPTDLLNINTGLSATGGDAENNDRGAGIIHFFKIFNLTEITDSSIEIAWQQEANGGVQSVGLTSVATLAVYDGIINKDSGFNFAHDIPVLSNVDGVRTSLSGLTLSGIEGASVGAGIGDFNMTIQTLNASSINWGSFNSSFATVVVSMRDPDSSPVGSNAGAYELFIANITVSKIGTWNFTNPQIIYTVEGNRQGAGDVCPKTCMDLQKGFIAERGFVNTTSFSLPQPPAQVTGLTVVQNMNNNATLDWDDIPDTDNYQVFRTDGSQWTIKEHTSFATSANNARYGYTISPNGTLLSNNADETGIEGNLGLLSFGEGYVLKTFTKSFIENKDIILEHQSYCGNVDCLVHGRLSIEVLNGDVESNIPTVFPTDLPRVATQLGIANAPVVPVTSIGIQNVTLDETGIDLSSADDIVTVLIRHSDQSVSVSTQHEIYRLFIGNASAGQTETIYDFSNPNINFTDLFEVGIFGNPQATLNNQNGTVVIGNGTVLIGSPVASEFTDTTISPITNLLNYTVRANNTNGFGINSTIVEFGLIQPITGLNATALNSTAINISWDQARTIHPSDPLTGVIIQRSQQIGIWNLTSGNDQNPTNHTSSYNVGAGLYITPDGTEMFVPDVLTDTVNKFSLTTPFEVSTAVSTQNSTDLSSTLGSKVAQITDVHFKLDGTKMFILESGNTDIYEYTLSTPFDLSTLAFNAEFTTLPTFIQGIWITEDGSRLYAPKSDNDRLFQFDLTTAWDITTLSQVADVPYLPSTGVFDVAVRSDGKFLGLLDIGGGLNDSVDGRNMTTAFDITTMITTGVGINVGQGGLFAPEPRSLWIPQSGSAVYVDEVADDEIFQFDMDTSLKVFGDFINVTTVDELITEFNDTGLIQNTTFIYRAKGQSAVSTGAFDLIVNATTDVGGVNSTQTETDVVTVLDERRNVIDKVIRNVEIFSGGGGATIFADNFTSYTTQGEADGNWTTTDTARVRVNISNDELDFSVPTSVTTNDGIAFDLGVALQADSKLALRYKLDIQTYSINSDATALEMHIGLSDSDETVVQSAIQDWIGLGLQTASNTEDYQVVASDGGFPSGGSSTLATFTRNLTQELIYVEMIRNSTTSLTINLFSDASFNTLLESQTVTIPAGITDLQYLKVMVKNSDGTANGDIIGIVDDIYLVEYDFFDNFETDNFTTMSGTRVSVDTVSRFMDWDSSGTGTYNQGEFVDPIGTTLDTEDWLLRAKLNITALSAGSDTTGNDLFIGFGDSNTLLPNQGQDFIGFRLSHNNPDGIIRVIASDGTVINTGATQGEVFTTNVDDLGINDVYLQVQRGVPNSTAVTATIFSDPLFLSPIESVEEVIEAGTTGIRYLKVMVSNRDGTGDSTYEGTIDDITFLNGGAGNVTLTFFTGDLVSSNDVVVITPPTIPEGITDLSASTVLNTCELSWSAPVTTSAINGYRIFRQVDGGGFTTLISNTTNIITTHNDTGLLMNILYEYDVRAGSRLGFANVTSNIESCLPVISGVPDAPSLVDVNEEPNGDVTIDWTEPAGSPTGYKIERKVGAGGFLVLIANTGNSLVTFTDTTTTPATQFTYRISGINAFGTGAFSNEGSITTASPPNAPLLSGAQNGDQIDISWTTPASANPITGYKIDRRINFGGFTTLIANTTTPNVLNFSDSNVTKPDTFGYRIRALSSAGEGTVSNVVDIIFGSHLIVKVREQDGSFFKGGGIVEGVNSTFNLLVGLDVNSNAIFDNLAVGNFNFTFTDADDFILNKTFNILAPSGNDTSEFTVNALVFDVDCPTNGAGTDIRIKVNYTDAKDITEFPSTPVCDSTDQVSWSTRWQGSAVNDTSTMVADFISTIFKANAEQFLASADVVPTSYNSGLNKITSETYVVNMTDVTINFNLFLGRAPAGGGGGGSGSQPTPQITIPDPEVVFAQRLTGLSILSRTHQFAQAGQVIEGSITVQWEGEDNLIVKGITLPDSDLDIRFDLPPFPLVQRLEGTGEFAMSSADIPYTIVLPPSECNADLGITINCFDPILHTLPLEFRFGLGDQEYVASTEVFVDGRPIPLDIVQLQIILLFMVLIASAVFGNFIRRRVKGGRRRQTRVKKKFKKKFDSS